jgi:transcriptional antiterminator RfaH
MYTKHILKTRIVINIIEKKQKTSLFNWWVVQTKPHNEVLAAGHLHQQGFTTFCPMYQKEIIRGRQVRVTTSPLFPCYLFVLADDTAKQKINMIRSTLGISKLLKIGEIPQLVNSSVIEKIKLLEAEHLLQVSSHYKKNDVVTITSGIYKGLEALYQIDEGLERAVVLLNLLQKETPLTLDKTKLKKIS